MFSPTIKNTAFFSTCNDAYIPYSATSLLSIRKHLPKARLFILSRNISDEHKKILEKLDIEYIDLDLRGHFYRHWDYPYETYYIFAGPELFLKKGFKYSVYIDGDILCLSDPLKHVGKISYLAGTAVGDCKGVFLNDYDLIRNYFALTQKQLSRERITSSVVYFNNKAMSIIKLLNLSTDYFKQCLDKNIPRKGDDSLLSLIQIICFKSKQIKNLGPRYNYIPSIFGKNLPKKLVFIHFIEFKPWEDFSKENPKIKVYLKKWHKLYSANFTPLKHKFTPHIKYLDQPPIKIFVSEDEHLGIKNFGDELPKDLIPLLFHRKVIPCSTPEDVDLFSVGSILFALPNASTTKPVYCWGSGFISVEPIEKELENLKRIHFTAVRGKTTLARVKRSNHNKDLPLGDPGILINLIFPASKTKLHQIGVVPHYIDANHPIVEKLRQDDRFFIIDPLDSPAIVAKQISSCDFVLSSSLHGLIFADSYGIPNAHINFSDKVYGGEYKFKDYDSGVGKKHLDADLDKLFDLSYLEKLKKSYRPIKNLPKIQQALIKAFPFK